jgi:hypothetical protein
VWVSGIVIDNTAPLPDFSRVNVLESAHADAEAGAERSAAGQLRMAAAEQGSEACQRSLGYSGQAPARFENLRFPEPAVSNGGFFVSSVSTRQFG